MLPDAEAPRHREESMDLGQAMPAVGVDEIVTLYCGSATDTR